MTATTINAFADIDNSIQGDENTNNTNLYGDMPSGLGELGLKAYPNIKVGEDFKSRQKLRA